MPRLPTRWLQPPRTYRVLLGVHRHIAAAHQRVLGHLQGFTRRRSLSHHQAGRAGGRAGGARLEEALHIVQLRWRLHFICSFAAQRPQEQEQEEEARKPGGQKRSFRP